MSPAPAPVHRIHPGTGAYAIEGYNHARPFSNFLPGIAGPLGVPCWAYWVNRAQCVASVGVGGRDGQIMELHSFNTAAMRVAGEGFRTLLRVDGRVHEPFRRSDDADLSQVLTVRPWGIGIAERHPGLGLEVTVDFANLAGHRTAGLVRRTTIASLHSEPIEVEWLDGVPRLIPGGVDRHGVKVIPRHIEAMFTVDRLEGVPLFRLSQAAADRAEIAEVVEATFYASDAATPVVVDPAAVFADPFAFEHPDRFAAGGVDGVLSARQAEEGRTPCAFTVRRDRLEPGERVTQVVVVGRARQEHHLARLVADLREPGFADRAFGAARTAVEAVSERAATVTASPELDAHLRQNFLDNVLRGGLPSGVEVPGAPLHLYWRQNADLERDYHEFDLEATYLSQGMSHFRNMLQNRRSDPWYAPGSGRATIALFAGLVQLDGYNPLEVHGTAHHYDAAAVQPLLEGLVEDSAAVAATLAARPRTPGEMLMALEDAGADVADWPALIGRVCAVGRPTEPGGREAGFWIDHWHYLVDAVEAHLAVEPDDTAALMRLPVAWFDNPDVVEPLRRRVVLTDDGPRQLGGMETDLEKAALISARGTARHRVRGPDGEVFRSPLAVKLLVLAATRLATIDPGGLGIEMDAGKPGWNDSLNGLPALFGSGVSELVELRRLLRLMTRWIDALDPDAGLEVPAALSELVAGLEAAGEAVPGTFARWRRTVELRDRYRERVRLGVDAITVMTAGQVLAFIRSALGEIDRMVAPERLWAPDGIPHTYVVNEVVTWEEGADGSIVPTAFRPEPTDPFLEGAVHWMREFPHHAAAVHAAVRASSLHDAALGMLRSSARVTDGRLGRAIGAYPRGWLENESIYTHMEYKYLLELLRSGLGEAFWEMARTALVPFLDPAVYGRSPLEGCSFIVSSAHADPTEHGRGYQPRLSGMTAEMIHIWLLALFGPAPFSMEGGGLAFTPRPALPGWLLTDAEGVIAFRATDGRPVRERVPPHSVATRLFGDTVVVVTGTGDPDPSPAAGFRVMAEGGTTVVDGPTLGDPHAGRLRDGLLGRLDIRLS